MSTTSPPAGSVVALWRYPVKSMLGEELNRTDLAERGLLGDRAYALVDRETEKIASAKNPRKWPSLFDFRAAYEAPPAFGEKLPPVRITFPNGRVLATSEGDVDRALSDELGRDVTLTSAAPEEPVLEEYWPDIEGLALRETTTDESMPAGTFFDLAVVHVLTTSTLDQLRELHPEGRFETRRFRPNLVVAVEDSGFVENDWIGRTLAVGDDVRLSVTGPCPRCVMTTLAQGDLPKDPGILRTAAKSNEANVGVYASVASGGTIHRGDAVSLE